MEINRLSKSGIFFVAEDDDFGAVELNFMDTDNQQKANECLKKFLEKIEKRDYKLDLRKWRKANKKMIIIIPSCKWCKKSDKMIQKTIWFKHKKQKHYVTVWICDRCNANNGVFWCG